MTKADLCAAARDVGAKVDATCSMTVGAIRKANRAKGDAMNTKHVKRGLSEEQISRESL